MLSQEEATKLMIQQNIPPIGRNVVESIRASEPSRRVGGGTHNVAVRFASRKMGVTIQAESHKNELPALYIWEHDSDTYEFYDQVSKVKLSYVNAAGKKCTYLSTPDFFVIQKDWIGWVECKTEEWLLDHQANGQNRFISDGNGGWRCPPGEQFASQYGLGFKVRSSKEIKWILVRNLEFLSDYFHESCPKPPDEAIRHIREIFAEERWMLLEELLQHEKVDANVVYKLIADGELHVDIESEILSETGYTSVCRDAVSAEIYANQKRARSNVPAIPLQSIRLAQGTRIMWDGKPWRIFNVGLNEIFIEDGERDVSNVRIDVFHSLVAQGAITGLPEPVNDRHRQAEQVLKKAAPVDLEQAIKRAACLDTSENCGMQSNVPSRTRRYWKTKALHGENAYANRFVGLLPRISARGNRKRKIPEESITVMNEVIDEKVLSDSKPNILACYGFVVNISKERGVICPSEKTFRAEIAKRRHDLTILAREGRKAAYSVTEFHWTLDQSTPRHGERPFEVGHIDHTELDVELVDSRSGANLGRPWLTVLMDAFSRMILAFFLTFDPPSYRSCMAVIREAVRRHGQIPRTMVVDQGSDFESVYFEALLGRLECHKKSRPAAKARFGSVIERFFGVSNQAFIHNLAGNSQALQRPRSMSPSHDPRTLAVWTLPRLIDMFEQYIDEHYANCRHSALGMSPKEGMANGLARAGNRPHLLIPYAQDFQFMCMPSTPAGKARIRAGRGVKIRGVHYWHSAFRDMGVAISLPVLYDPFDISRAYALVRGEWVLCRSEYAALFERRTEREIGIISQEIRALHIQRGIHRQVKASDIASFLSIVQESEAVLRQQRRDAQQSTSAMSLTTVEASPSLSENAPTVECLGDAWAGKINAEIYGDLK